MSDSWELVAAAQSGDMRAFGELYTRNREAIFKLVLYRTGNRELAKDLTSEVFTRALRGINRLTNRGRDVQGWFVIIALNLIADHWKSAYPRRERSFPLLGRVEIGDAVEIDARPLSAPSAEDVYLSEYQREQTQARVRAAVARLTPEQRACVTLRYLHECSVTDTAQQLGIAQGAVKARCYRASATLGGLLATEDAA